MGKWNEKKYTKMKKRQVFSQRRRPLNTEFITIKMKWK